MAVGGWWGFIEGGGSQLSIRCGARFPAHWCKWNSDAPTGWSDIPVREAGCEGGPAELDRWHPRRAGSYGQATNSRPNCRQFQQAHASLWACPKWDGRGPGDLMSRPVHPRTTRQIVGAYRCATRMLGTGEPPGVLSAAVDT